METLAMVAEESFERPGLGLWLVTFFAGSLINWVVLMVVIPVAQRLADFGMPPLVEMCWKLALIVLGANLAAELLGLVNPWLGWGAGFVVFWAAMTKVFDLDLFGAVILVVVSWILRNFLIATLMASLA